MLTILCVYHFCSIINTIYTHKDISERGITIQIIFKDRQKHPVHQTKRSKLIISANFTYLKIEKKKKNSTSWKKQTYAFPTDLSSPLYVSLGLTSYATENNGQNKHWVQKNKTKHIISSLNSTSGEKLPLHCVCSLFITCVQLLCNLLFSFHSFQ